MCDDLGISDEKIRVYSLTYLGSTVTCDSLKQIMDIIKYEINDWEDDSNEEFLIRKHLMKKSTYDNLNEFDGF